MASVSKPKRKRFKRRTKLHPTLCRYQPYLRKWIPVKIGLSSLTKREFEVLKIVVSLKPMKDIATHLGISERTVWEHRDRIMVKLDLPQDGIALARLVTFCFRSKLIK